MPAATGSVVSPSPADLLRQRLTEGRSRLAVVAATGSAWGSVWGSVWGSAWLMELLLVHRLGLALAL
jgi:hypothetical protein